MAAATAEHLAETESSALRPVMTVIAAPMMNSPMTLRVRLMMTAVVPSVKK